MKEIYPNGREGAGEGMFGGTENEMDELSKMMQGLLGGLGGEQPSAGQQPPTQGPGGGLPFQSNPFSDLD